MTETTATLERTGTARPATTSPDGGRASAAVWFRVYRHHLRVLRNQAIAWILVIAGVGAGVAAGFQDAYPTEAARRAAAASIEGVPAFEALFGRTVELATVEGFVLWRWGGFAILVVAAWGMLSGAKLLRGAEESGHVEPLRAGALSPRGLLGAVLAAMFTVFALLAAAVGLSHTAVGMDAATSWALGATLAMLAAMGAAGSALAAQIVDSRRRVLGVVSATLGVLLAVRVLAAGEATPSWLWVASPFGWASYLHETDQARGAVLIAYAVLVAALVAAAVGFGRRDLHSAVVRRGEDRADGAPPVRGQLGLALRSTLGPVVAWGVGLAAAALVFGLLAADFAAAFGDLEETREMAAQIGMVALDTAEGVIASMLLFLALVLALFAAAQAAALREEEASWRIEPLLVRPLGRVRWLLTRAAVSAGAIAVLAVITSVAAWAGTAIAGAGVAFGDVVPAAVNLVPVAWMFLGIGVALVGVAPRLTAPVVYGVVVAAYVLDLVGGLLELPERVLELSPFRHLTAVPSADWAVGAAAIMVLVGLVGAAVGAARFRRRDLQEA